MSNNTGKHAIRMTYNSGLSITSRFESEWERGIFINNELMANTTEPRSDIDRIEQFEIGNDDSETMVISLTGNETHDELKAVGLSLIEHLNRNIKRHF